jgi:Zn-dependent protease
MAKGTNMREVINFLIGAGLVWGVGASMLRFQLFSLFFYVNSIIFLMAFILHEFAHKMAAKKNGLIGEFQLSPWGAVLTLFSIFLPLKVIAPGAVMIYGYADMKRMGRIAMWGPLTNIIMASIMLPFLLTFGRIIAVAYYLNAFIALFNLLPIGILDGKKIISWNRIIWAALFVQALIHIIIGYISL